MDALNSWSTDRFDPRRAWTNQMTRAVYVGIPRQLPHSIPPSGFGSALEVPETSFDPVDTIHSREDYTTPTFTYQGNLGASLSSVDDAGRSVTQYECSNSLFGQFIYHQNVDNLTTTPIVYAPLDFGYECTELLPPTQPTYGVAQTSQRREYDEIQHASLGSYLGVPSPNLFYPGNRHVNSFHVGYPYYLRRIFQEGGPFAMALQEREAQPSCMISFNDASLDSLTMSSKSSVHGNMAGGVIPKYDPLHITPSVRQVSSGDRKRTGGPCHYSCIMSAHGKAITFDSETSGTLTAGIDQTKAEHRKSKKKSKGSKRTHCKYVCPLSRKPCDQSVSRKADIPRHMQRHRRAEETMVHIGLLLLDQQTNFEKFKAGESILCRKCGTSFGRKDTLIRHLKNAGKACRSFYPEISIAD